MASTFYARYVPPTKVTSLDNGPSRTSVPPGLSKKRVRDEAETDRPKMSKKTKKNRDLIDEGNEAFNEICPRSKAPETPRDPRNASSDTKYKLSRKRKDERPLEVEHAAQSEVRPEEPNKSSIKRSKKSKKTVQAGVADGTATHEASDMRNAVADDVGISGNGHEVENELPNLSNGRSKRRETKLENLLLREKTSRDLDEKHIGVRDKFDKSLKNSQDKVSRTRDKQADSDPPSREPVETHGLVPLPQPPPAPEPDKPSFTGLPSWVAHPLRVSLDDKRPFSGFGINAKLLTTLKGKGYDKTFAVQTAVIPLLLRGLGQHNGDVCISAATGSGKTLAYVLPMIESLRDRVVTKLRGLIVVPTRELVKQVREVCELCASGTGLQIGIAIGSKSLRDEQESIMKKVQRHDPQQYQKEYKRPASDVDWATFNLQDLLTSVEEATDPLPDHVMEHSSKVDILICTPGRLVDHIRSTKGFSLELVQWLIIDEADRLLNESFQEWVDVVMPALDSEKPHNDMSELQQFLSGMKLKVPRPRLRKIVCSATLTRDISKLNSLRLKRPKLVTVGQADSSVQDMEDPQLADESGTYNLPSLLQEYAITVTDEPLKPLYLLNLLLNHIHILEGVESPKRQKISSRASEASGLGSGPSDSHSDTESSSLSSSNTSSEGSASSDSEASSAAASPSTPTLSFTSPAIKPTVLIFTSSTSATHRLAHLLSILHPTLTRHLTTLTRTTPSQKAISSLLSPTAPVRIAIATDRASRGLDIPFLGHVISYDVPTSLTGYVHRVGRTARAGREGTAWNLVSWREGKWWWNSIGKEGVEGVKRETKVKRVRVDVEMDETRKRDYEEALRKLGEDVKEKGRKA